MRILLCLGLFATVLFTGCTTSYVDGRSESEICEIHHAFMRSEDLPGQKKFDPPSREYMQARVKGFVHSYPFFLPYQKRTRYVVYICDECVRAEQEWKRQHPGEKH